MVTLYENGGYFIGNTLFTDTTSKENIQQTTGLQVSEQDLDIANAKKGTMSYDIFHTHNTSTSMDHLEIKFDAIASHDITYVGIIQTARASGLTEFPLPYVLTNCHNSLCAVGGTINEDDHVFGLSAAKKYGGIYVPAHQAVIHSYMRETMAGCGKMILGSDSHTRYGALGTMAMGEGGPELVKQLLNRTYDISYPNIIGVYLEGSVKPGVGPQDVALALIGKVFDSGFVKNAVLEFIGPSIPSLSMDYRFGIDVMTTETTCLSSIWTTDTMVQEFLLKHGRVDEYKELVPKNIAYYDKIIRIDLSKVEPMIALPFHPSNTYTIDEVNANPYDIFRKVEEDAKSIFGKNINYTLTNKIKDGKVMVDQGIIAGCSGGTYENINIAAKLLHGKYVGDHDYTLSVYPGSQPIYHALTLDGSVAKLMEAGATIKTAFCGPCFGAGDVPSNNALSIRHTTRNFPNREGSKPSEGQISSVALMDARSIAATSIQQGILTKATELDFTDISCEPFTYNKKIYDHRIYQGFHKAETTTELKYGPNIKDWPTMISLPDNLLLEVTCNIRDAVTTTDELIPSGETSSYRSNPLRLAEFALSRKDKDYVPRSKAVQVLEKERLSILSGEKNTVSEKLEALVDLAIKADSSLLTQHDVLTSTSIGSIIYANKPGDGSAREQAASVQKVLGGWGNIAIDYATKRYRSNLVNWGLLPLITNEENLDIKVFDYVYLKDIKSVIDGDKDTVEVTFFREDTIMKKTLYLPNMTKKERGIISAGCLINYYQNVMD